MDPVNYALQSVAIGAGATLVMDAWTAVRRPLLGTPAPDYRMVGRWFAHMARGRFRHDRIASAPAARGELWLGWIAHYAVGIAFAAVLLALRGVEWVREPTLAPAMLVGVGSVLAPFFVMQPAMGAGIAASRTPRPAVARLQSITTHAFFGFGLYAATTLLNTFSN